MTLAEFLLARIAEDEAAAGHLHDDRDCNRFFSDEAATCTCEAAARALAECSAKRRIVQAALNAETARRTINEVECPPGHEVRWRIECAAYEQGAGAWQAALRAISLPYAAREDYPSWWATPST